jgi:hypothetical protein
MQKMLDLHNINDNFYKISLKIDIFKFWILNVILSQYLLMEMALFIKYVEFLI